jgi:thioredoxin 1
MSQLKEVTDAKFEDDVLNSKLPVLVDFWADWCPPCQVIEPFLEDAADAYDGKLNIVKIDSEENPDMTAKYGIRGIPTLAIFKDGKLITTKAGAIDKKELSAFIKANL